jgi:hypothetical protein
VHESIAALAAGMEEDLARLREAGDARRFFHATYLRTTRAVGAEIDRGGFADGPWLARWDLAFAQLYLDALAADLAGAPVPAPWRVAFDTARTRPGLPPLRHVLFGMNAHINYDLPQALIAVITPAEFDDPAVLRAREADHRHVDEVLLARVSAEDTEMKAVSAVSLVDRLLGPANRAATRRILTESRAKVWANTALLDRSRRDGPHRYATVLGELEALAGLRLADLVRPGPVLLRLARNGFGVSLPDSGASHPTR